MTRQTTEHSFDAFDREAWSGLSDRPTPFMDWRFLTAMESSASIGREAGWQPIPMAVRGDDGALLAATSSFLKAHSHGEFVFDWAWARASHSIGLAWYPKLLVASPFSPVPGPRLLGAGQHRQAAAELVSALENRVNAHALSSAGVNFCSEQDAELLREAGWLERGGWQFHWNNPGYRDFDDFLERMRRKPRKNIRAERRRVQEAGWRFEWRDGTQIDDDDLDLIERCYQSTFQLYGNHAALNRDFFARSARNFGPQFLICKALLDDKALAAAVFWRDDRRLYGRYWGSLDDTRDVHFEACYYQGIDYCIREGLEWFEPGAQGEHKIRRGFLPVRTRSFHYIRHVGLRDAIARYLLAEDEQLSGYRAQLESLDPFA